MVEHAQQTFPRGALTGELTAGEATTAIAWIGETALFALGDGSVRICPEGKPAISVAAHAGAILCAVPHPNGVSVVTGGDDGRVLRVDLDGKIACLGAFGTAWVEHVVASPASRLIVAGVGKEALVWQPGSAEVSYRFAFPSTVAGLSFDSKGKRLAVAHYGGASLVWASSSSGAPRLLKWAGSHIACTLRPDSEYLVTGVQETGLHGWKLPAGLDMAMSGYSAKTRSFSWNRRATMLATSGDMRAILWPFDGKTGPMGRAPRIVGDRDVLVTQVTFHPIQDVLAIGYADGAVALVRIDDERTGELAEPEGGAVTALAWNASGTRLAFGSAKGSGGLIDLAARRLAPSP